MNKAGLRRELAKRRGAIPGRSLLDARIAEHILSLPAYRAAKTVMAYAAIRSEPSLFAIFEACFKAGKRLVLPALRGGRMEALEHAPDSALAEGAFHVPEPRGRVIPPGEIDLILCPGLGFGRDGARLGYGRGCYDRFLSETRALRAGVCYGACLLGAGEIPVEEWDRPMDFLVTEDGASPRAERKRL
ncbi:MAG: 5-formyltetrahydrofolate cyclo-ligase [Christensenellaceae bacterium]|jgi:5-formyltetrahydrofolate cyclo-ligase|nr:5-formyltetrahydrofolate cyclo-ligase [Christensenellaceae bacterium]